MAETYETGGSVSEVARRHDVNANLLFTWRRTLGVGRPARADGPTGFVPAVIGAPAMMAAALSKSPSGAMEIVLAGGDRVIVNRTVDAVALAAVIEVLSRR